MTPPVDAGVIDSGAKAVETISKPSVFPTAICLICLLGSGYLVYTTNRRADAQVIVMQRIADQLGAMQKDLDIVKILVERKPK